MMLYIIQTWCGVVCPHQQAGIIPQGQPAECGGAGADYVSHQAGRDCGGDRDGAHWVGSLTLHFPYLKILPQFIE